MEAGVMEPDLTVLFDEDEPTMAHSLILRLSSPVFEKMLGSGMRESQSNQVALPGKSKREFDLFLSFLQPARRETVTAENVEVLLRWFDEYQVHDDLKNMCERFLSKQYRTEVTAKGSLKGKGKSVAVEERQQVCKKYLLLAARFTLKTLQQLVLQEIQVDISQLPFILDILAENSGLLMPLMPRLKSLSSEIGKIESAKQETKGLKGALSAVVRDEYGSISDIKSDLELIERGKGQQILNGKGKRKGKGIYDDDY